MEKLEIIKTFFKNENIEMDKYVYRCFLIIELGKSIFCKVKELGDLFYSIEEITQDSFQMIINQLIFVYGQKVHDYEKWLEDNPESEKWLDIINEYMVLLTNFQNNPLHSYKEIYEDDGSISLLNV